MGRRPISSRRESLHLLVGVGALLVLLFAAAAGGGLACLLLVDDEAGVAFFFVPLEAGEVGGVELVVGLWGVSEGAWG